VTTTSTTSNEGSTPTSEPLWDSFRKVPDG
jgi:hypothetical protein